jgi:hypothetical protein
VAYASEHLGLLDKFNNLQIDHDTIFSENASSHATMKQLKADAK